MDGRCVGRHQGVELAKTIGDRTPVVIRTLLWKSRGNPAAWDPPNVLDVAGYPQNDRNNRTGYDGHHMGHDTEIEAHLRTNHR